VTRNALKSLHGIEGLTALERLDLRLSTVPDLGPLAGCRSLVELRLVDVPAARDLAPLAGLTTLRRLHISPGGLDGTVEVDSLAPLAALPALEELDLERVVVADGDLSLLQRLGGRAPTNPTELDELAPRPPARPGDPWYLRADLSRRFAVATNDEAETALRALVRRTDRALDARLQTERRRTSSSSWPPIRPTSGASPTCCAPSADSRCQDGGSTTPKSCSCCRTFRSMSRLCTCWISALTSMMGRPSRCQRPGS
jgi:hypothetical protein